MKDEEGPRRGRAQRDARGREEGIVAGGGVALRGASTAIDGLKLEGGDEGKVGAMIVRRGRRADPQHRGEPGLEGA